MPQEKPPTKLKTTPMYNKSVTTADQKPKYPAVQPAYSAASAAPNNKFPRPSDR